MEIRRIKGQNARYCIITEVKENGKKEWSRHVIDDNFGNTVEYPYVFIQEEGKQPEVYFAKRTSDAHNALCGPSRVGNSVKILTHKDILQKENIMVLGVLGNLYNQGLSDQKKQNCRCVSLENMEIGIVIQNNVGRLIFTTRCRFMDKVNCDERKKIKDFITYQLKKRMIKPQKQRD